MMVQDPKFRVSLEALGVVEEGVLDAQKHSTFSSGWKTAAVVMLSVLSVLAATVVILVVSGCHAENNPSDTPTPAPVATPMLTQPKNCYFSAQAESYELCDVHTAYSPGTDNFQVYGYARRLAAPAALCAWVGWYDLHMSFSCGGELPVEMEDGVYYPFHIDTGFSPDSVGLPWIYTTWGWCELDVNDPDASGCF